jgi:MoaA/NifB/PqqE/SkfB family radical SAM enzyme
LENFVRPALKECKLLAALGSGELFASVPLRNFYKTLSRAEFPNLRLRIISNGQLLSPETWSEFSNLNGMVDFLRISIDAAKESTYENIRRGGSWDKLCRNMEFMATLRRKHIKSLDINFVVQKSNFREIPGIIELAHKWNVDSIWFQKLDNWGTFSEEDFTQNDISNPKHELYNDLKNIIADAMHNTSGVAIHENIFPA